MQKIRGFMRIYIPKFTIVAFALALISVLTLIISSLSFGFADFVNSTVSTAFRFIMAKLTQLIPFSLFELLMYLVLPLIISLVILGIKRFGDKISRVRYAFVLFGVVCIIYSGYIFALALPYNVTPLNNKLELEYTEITAENLYDTAKILLDNTNSLAGGLEFSEDGSSEMPYSLDTLSEKICEAYDILDGEYDFITTFSSRAKPIKTEGAMASLHLLGIYTFFTGESNICMDFCDFNLPYTVAHEFAHQRGIIRENEANFVAFLVCISSSDDYIKYSGYLRLYEYVASALYRTDKELYKELLATMSDKVRGDLICDSLISEKYADSFVGKISNSLNDIYLKMNGTEGTASYGLVTRLAVAYYNGK